MVELLKLTMIFIFALAWIPILITLVAIFLNLRKKRKINPEEETKNKIREKIKREMLEEQIRAEIQEEMKNENT